MKIKLVGQAVFGDASGFAPKKTFSGENAALPNRIFLHQIGSLRHAPSTAIMFRSCKKHPLPDGKGCPCEKVYKEEVGICPHGTDRLHFGDVKL